MSVYHGEIEINGELLRPTYEDISDRVRDHVKQSGIRDGICVVYSHHTTCSVITQESSHDTNLWGTEYLQQDLFNIMEDLVPTCRTEGQYLHPGPKHVEFAETVAKEEGKFSLNTDAHLRSVFFGRSETITVNKGHLSLGEFGYIYFIDWDQLRSRQRVCEVQIIGE